MPRTTNERPRVIEEIPFEPISLVEPVLPAETLLDGIEPNDPWGSASALRARHLENTGGYTQSIYETPAPQILSGTYTMSFNADESGVTVVNANQEIISRIEELDVGVRVPANVDRRCIVRAERKQGIESVKTE